MPKPKGAKASPLESALAALCHALSKTEAPWMVIGGIAIISHGVQRMTTDIDAVIEGATVPLSTLLAALRRSQIVPRIESAEAFAETNLVLLARHTPTEVDLDLSFGWTEFERDAVARRKNRAFGSVEAPMADVEALLVFKAIAARARDIDDAMALLSLQPKLDLKRVRREVVKLAGLAESPQLVAGFDDLVRRACTALPSRSRRARPAVTSPSVAERPTKAASKKRRSKR